jgi:hypothetical protein
VNRGRLAIHAHFYQPLRADPFTGRLPVDPSAAPYPDWNSRIAAECYRPNAELGTLGHVSFDVGPALADWLAEHDPTTWAGFVAGDRPVSRDPATPSERGNAMAQAFHHSILPLASVADRDRGRWASGVESRFGHLHQGSGCQTAVNRPTLQTLADGASPRHPAPWRVAPPDIDTRRPYRSSSCRPLGRGGGLRRGARPRCRSTWPRQPMPTGSRAVASPQAGRHASPTAHRASCRLPRTPAVRTPPGVSRPLPAPARRAQARRPDRGFGVVQAASALVERRAIRSRS